MFVCPRSAIQNCAVAGPRCDPIRARMPKLKTRGSCAYGTKALLLTMRCDNLRNAFHRGVCLFVVFHNRSFQPVHQYTHRPVRIRRLQWYACAGYILALSPQTSTSSSSPSPSCPRGSCSCSCPCPSVAGASPATAADALLSRLIVAVTSAHFLCVRREEERVLGRRHRKSIDSGIPSLACPHSLSQLCSLRAPLLDLLLHEHDQRRFRLRR